jgi:hypothetical protein
MSNVNQKISLRKSSIYIAICILFLLFSLTTFSIIYTNQNIKSTIYETFFLTHHHFKPCRELPNKKEVEKVLIEQKQNPNRQGLNISTDLTKDVSGCEDKADLVLMVQNKEDMQKAKTRLGKDFYGIPYRIINF